MQDACLRLFARSSALPDKALLFITIRHLFIDHYRRSKRVVIDSEENLDEVVDANTLDNTPDIANTVGQRAMDLALAALREEEREVIYLNVIEGYSAQEIATMTATSRNTVLSLLHRGKTKLRLRLGQYRDNISAAPENCDER